MFTTTLQNILLAIDKAGGKPLLVGGCVRDSLLGIRPEDYDVEVYRLPPATLRSILCQFGHTGLVGESFGVFKLRTEDGQEYDFSLPRRESKIGAGHKGFEMHLDLGMTPEEASARRDFTINSIMFDPFDIGYIDPHNGFGDLRHKVLRHTSDHFGEDPLRVLRGMQFVSRFDLDAHPSTIKVCKSLLGEHGSLARERVWMEWYKWASKSVKPSKGLQFLADTGWLGIYSTIDHLWLIPQDSIHHPEGNVWVHTLLVTDAGASIAIRDGLSDDDRAILVLACLLHDVGKITTTFEEGGRIKSPGHAEAGIYPARNFLNIIGCPTRISQKVLSLVAEHMFPTWIEQTVRSVRRLKVRLANGDCTITELLRVIEADYSGRPPLPGGLPKGAEQLSTFDRELPPKIERILNGRDLIKLGWEPGKEMGQILKDAFEAQLDEQFSDLEGAIKWVKSR